MRLKCFNAVGNAYCYKITLFPCFFPRCIPMDLWNYSLFNNILLVTYESHFSLNWLISLESHITLNFLFYFLNVPNRLSGIVQIRVTVVSWTWCAFLVLFIDVHSIDTFGIAHFLASIQSFCPGSVSGLMKYIPHTLLSCFSTTLYGVQSCFGPVKDFTIRIYLCGSNLRERQQRSLLIFALPQYSLLLNCSYLVISSRVL